jgi:hypothetical protein
MHIEVPEFSQAFAADGGTSGSIQVADSSGFYVGCIAYLRRTDANARVIIVSIPDATHVGVRIIGDVDNERVRYQVYGAQSDLTGWTTAKGSRISMPQQLAQIEPSILKPTKANI